MGRCHLEMLINDDGVRVIDSREVEVEIQFAPSDDLTQRLKTRDYITVFPASDDGSGLPDSGSELGLGQASTQPCFSDQIAGHHEDQFSTYLI